MDNLSNNWEAVFRKLEDGRSEPDWLSERREAAWQDFSRSGFPSARVEQWKYTDLTAVGGRYADGFGEPAAEQNADTAEMPAIPDNAVVIHCRNGQLEAPAELPDGLLIDSPDSDAATSLVGKIGAQSKNPVTAFNLAFGQDGIVIRALAGKVIGQPVFLLFTSAGNHRFPTTRVTVEVERGATLEIIEHHVSLGDSISNTVIEGAVRDGARLTYTKVQQEGDEATHLAGQYFELGRDAFLDVVNLDLGAALGRNDLSVTLADQGARAELHGLFMGAADCHIDNHTLLDHAAPNTSSLENYRGIIAGRGTGVFNGSILVHQAAQKTDAQMQNKNLLLAANAEINSKPELEIYADDVKCAHGSTTGQLDDNHLFYLRSRGIPTDVARQMLIEAFAEEVLARIPHAGIREQLSAAAQRRLREEPSA